MIIRICGDFRTLVWIAAIICAALITAAACIMGIYSKNRFEFALNIIVPFVLIGLGFIMPYIKKRRAKKEYGAKK